MTAEGGARWQPLSREEFIGLRRGQELRDRRGRVWTVVAEPFLEEGYTKVIVRSSDLARRVDERFADEYALA